jgi:hypothetical protein
MGLRETGIEYWPTKMSSRWLKYSAFGGRKDVWQKPISSKGMAQT